MRAHDIMTEPVVTATPDMSIHDAARLCIDMQIGGMPVVDASGQVVGIVCHRDLLHCIEKGTRRAKRAWWLAILLPSPHERAAKYAKHAKKHGHTVANVMYDQVISIDEEMALPQIADLMERAHLDRLPVLRDGRLVGIVSRANLMRALASVEPVIDRVARVGMR
jgi:CBS domain-containing protein